MINSLSLANFKCFDRLNLELAPLTLLTGFNAAGKSTAIQTLLLLSQTLRAHRRTAALRLNGPLVNLGSPGDVLNSQGGMNRLDLGIEAAGWSLLWRFALADGDRRSLQVHRLEGSGESFHREFEGDSLDGLRPAENIGTDAMAAVEDLIFLSAARQVDTEVFPLPQDLRISRGDVGPIGQYAAWWLHEEGDTAVAPERHCGGARSAGTLRQHVNSWTSDLFPGAEVNAVPLARTNLMRLELRSGRTSDWKPANIGYGISYALPLLVAGLCAEPGRSVIVDSPEAHLHPRGQSRIGCFLAQMAAAGVQMIVETHSDHVLNGVRIAVQQRLVAPEDLAVYFFTNRVEAPVRRLSIDRNGSVSDWPEGFFDQAERDLASLAGWG